MQITSKGQVTIPQAIRNRLGLLPHTEVEWEVVDGRASIRRAAPAAGMALEHVVPSSFFGAALP